MRKAIALVVMIVVCSIYFVAMNHAGEEKQVATTDNTLVENIKVQDVRLEDIRDTIQEIEEAYPSTPKALIEMHNDIMGLQYGENVISELTEETMKALRMLYSKELISLNDSNRQLELLAAELKHNKEVGIYLVGSTIESIAFPTPDTALIEIMHEMTRESQKRQYTLIKQEGLWKIHSWKDLALSEDKKALEE